LHSSFSADWRETRLRLITVTGDNALGGSALMQTLARQKYWEISLRVEPKISTLCNFTNFKDYKKARQIRDAG
jgi:hypothetical protein